MVLLLIKQRGYQFGMVMAQPSLLLKMAYNNKTVFYH